MDTAEEALLRAILHRLDEMKNILARMEKSASEPTVFPPMMGVATAQRKQQPV
jgi:hypothetical protein